MLEPIELVTRRTQDKLTQEEFAKILKISQNYLSELERGSKKVTKALETRYNRLYPKRLISITTGRGVECPRCNSVKAPEKLSEPKDELDTVYRCTECDYYFALGEAYGLHYRA